MKQFLTYLALALGLISCGLNSKKITQTEFERLFTHDSIQSINLFTNKQEAQIRIKSTHEKNACYILPIESTESFEASFKNLRDTLNAHNNHISYSISTTSGSELPFYLLPLIGPVFLLCSLILFLFTIIDLLKSKFDSATDKLIWLLVIILIPFIGPILYIVIGRKQKLLKS